MGLPPTSPNPTLIVIVTASLNVVSRKFTAEVTAVLNAAGAEPTLVSYTMLIFINGPVFRRHGRRRTRFRRGRINTEAVATASAHLFLGDR
jgi:hypothetical protein